MFTALNICKLSSLFKMMPGEASQFPNDVLSNAFAVILIRLGEGFLNLVNVSRCET